MYILLTRALKYKKYNFNKALAGYLKGRILIGIRRSVEKFFQIVQPVFGGPIGSHEINFWYLLAL